MRTALAIALLLAALGGMHNAFAGQKGARIGLDARAHQDVDNDVMRATLFVEAEDTDPARLADKVNRATTEGLQAAREFTGLRTRTSGYSTYPVTVEGKIARWRARSEISVEGEDFARMADAIGRLQAGMQLGSVEFSVSPQARAKAEDALTQSAIQEFLRKAENVARGFQGKRFEVLEAQVSADGGYYPPPRPMAMMKSTAEGVSAPALEAGTTRITVTVTGAILVPRGSR